MTAIVRPTWPTLPIGSRSIVAGVVGALALLTIYLGIISLVQGIGHALEQLATDAVFVSLIATGFGIQIALFTELRTVDRRHRAAATAVTAAGTGTSAAAMLACCAHHLVALLPLVGLSGAAVFLNAYQTPIFLVSIAMNVVGIVVVGRQLHQARRVCNVIGQAA